MFSGYVDGESVFLPIFGDDIGWCILFNDDWMGVAVHEISPAFGIRQPSDVDRPPNSWHMWILGMVHGFAQELVNYTPAIGHVSLGKWKWTPGHWGCPILQNRSVFFNEMFLQKIITQSRQWGISIYIYISLGEITQQKPDESTHGWSDKRGDSAISAEIAALCDFPTKGWFYFGGQQWMVLRGLSHL